MCLLAEIGILEGHIKVFYNFLILFYQLKVFLNQAKISWLEGMLIPSYSALVG